MSRRDDLYTRQATEPGSFRFDEQVVEVFPDMIDRSVPGYALIVPMIGQLARRYVQPHSTVHDLGCSLGAVTLAIRTALQGGSVPEGVRLVATDNAGAMIRRLEGILDAAAIPRVTAQRNESNESNEGDETDVPTLAVQLQQADIRDVAIDNASMAVLNFTLQFLDPGDRDRLLQRVHQGLKPGGVLILAEKVRFDDEATATRQTEWHHDYKRLQGYSELEIARKRTALERVLLAETEAAQIDRLHRCGFSRVTRWFQCFGFHAWLAER